MIDNLACVSLGNAGFDFLQLPSLGFQVSLNSFVEEIGAVAVHGCSKGVKSGDFRGFEAEANRLFIHNLV